MVLQDLVRVVYGIVSDCLNLEVPIDNFRSYQNAHVRTSVPYLHYRAPTTLRGMKICCHGEVNHGSELFYSVNTPEQNRSPWVADLSHQYLSASVRPYGSGRTLTLSFAITRQDGRGDDSRQQSECCVLDDGN